MLLFQVYGGEARISTLRKLFPLLEDKKSLTSPMERAGVAGKASLSAAVDYYVSMHSDVFISASPGNMHNALVSLSLLLLLCFPLKVYEKNVIASSGYHAQYSNLSE